MKKISKYERGAAILEYTLLTAMLAVMAISAVNLLGKSIQASTATAASCAFTVDPSSPGCVQVCALSLVAEAGFSFADASVAANKYCGS